MYIRSVYTIIMYIRIFTYIYNVDNVDKEGFYKSLPLRKVKRYRCPGSIQCYQCPTYTYTPFDAITRYSAFLHSAHSAIPCNLIFALWFCDSGDDSCGNDNGEGHNVIGDNDNDNGAINDVLCSVHGFAIMMMIVMGMIIVGVIMQIGGMR